MNDQFEFCFGVVLVVHIPPLGWCLLCAPLLGCFLSYTLSCVQFAITPSPGEHTTIEVPSVRLEDEIKSDVLLLKVGGWGEA